MTGPEHYRKAEEHLGFARQDEMGSDSERYNLAIAQVHATLALAAGTVMSGSLNRLGREAWDKVSGASTSTDAETAGAA